MNKQIERNISLDELIDSNDFEKLKKTMNMGFEAIRLNIQDYESTKRNLKEVEGPDLNNVREESVYFIENKLLPPLKEALESKDSVMELLSTIQTYTKIPQDQFDDVSKDKLLDEKLLKMGIEIKDENGIDYNCAMGEVDNKIYNGDLSVFYQFKSIKKEIMDPLFNLGEFEAKKILLYIINNFVNNHVEAL